MQLHRRLQAQHDPAPPRMPAVSPRTCFPLLLLLTACQVHAAERWFTVTGDEEDQRVDTVQVDPIARSGLHHMQVRVSRAVPRVSWDGIAYQSFVADVHFDCEAKRARYQRISYYTQPRWQGSVYREVDYQSGEPRWMEFRDMAPNPMQRIVAAACQKAPGRQP